MMIYGPIIERVCIATPYGWRMVFDESAYWNLDFDGVLLVEGNPATLMYAKVAYPTLASAQRQFELERQARGWR